MYFTSRISYSRTPPGAAHPPYLRRISRSAHVRSATIRKFIQFDVGFIVTHDLIGHAFAPIPYPPVPRWHQRPAPVGVEQGRIDDFALESLPSRSAMRPSIKLCFSLAAWYSAFSDKSPCARASAIAVNDSWGVHGFQFVQFGAHLLRAVHGQGKFASCASPLKFNLRQTFLKSAQRRGQFAASCRHAHTRRTRSGEGGVNRPPDCCKASALIA